MIKTSDIFQLKDILQNILPLIFRNITGIGDKESLRHCLNQEVQEDMMAKFNVASSAAAAPAAAKSFQSCPTPCHPMDRAHQAPTSTGFSRQEYWSGLPFPSPVASSMEH